MFSLVKNSTVGLDVLHQLGEFTKWVALELLGTSHFFDGSFAHHNDLVGVHDCLEAMSDSQDGAPFKLGVDQMLDFGFSLNIDVRSCLV